MANEPGISTARQGELLRAVFQTLLDNPNGLPGREVLDRMQEVVPFTEYEAGHYPSNPNERRGVIATRFYTVNCVKAGWLKKARTAWTVTEAGREAFETYSDPRDFARESSRRYQAWKKEQEDAGGTTGDIAVDLDAVSSEAEAITETMSVEIAEEAAWGHIQSHLSVMDPYDFQDLVAALLKAMGYHVGWVSPPGPDRGIDIVAYTDPLGATGPRIKVQVKRRLEKTNVDGVRSFLAVLGPHDVGLYISAGGFTSDAEREVRSQENRRITLIDMEKLFDLWVEHYGAIDDGEKGLLPLRPVYFLAPTD
ncbi:restriction endonuclease [Gemmatimonas sp.]|uniref:restriction endonuclease n=1 Tax=Gemmatimonas sp. TaxID=1962908 RepID=UPI003564D17F